MAGDPFRKVNPGDDLRIPAPAYNAFIDAAQAHKRRNVARDARGFIDDSGIILVKNTTASYRNRFDAVGLGAPITLPIQELPEFQRRVILEGKLLDGTSYLGKFGVLLKPLDLNEIGPACVAGVCIARVSVPDADDTATVEAVASGGRLEAIAFGGAGRTIWIEGTGDPRWAVINIGPHQKATRIRGLANGAISGVGAKTIDNLKALDGYFKITGTSQTLSVQNIHAFAADDNGEVRVELNETDSQWEIYQVTCAA